MSEQISFESFSIADENTPNNFQDNVNQPKKDLCEHYEAPYVATKSVHEQCYPEDLEENAAEILEEQTPRENTDLGKFSEPIFKGKGFHRASNFHDSECGEPEKNQYLRLDFTPIEGVDDNEFILNKCRNFWAFVESHQEIKGLRALPIKLDEDELKTLSTTLSHLKEPTAIECLNDQELVSKAFVTEHTTRYCADSGGDYSNWEIPKLERRSHARSSVTGPRRRSNSRKSTNVSAEEHSSDEVKTLCKQLDEWDLAHPKSMEPPGHPAQLDGYLQDPTAGI